MVERLFRAKRLDNGEWVYGGYAHIYSNPNTDIIVTGRMCLDEDSDEISLESRNIDPSTLGQYTGLTDKNGKQIFEGDIFIDPDYSDTIYQVDYADGAFIAKERTTNEQFFLRDFVAFGKTEAEVIGNVHDNIQ